MGKALKGVELRYLMQELWVPIVLLATIVAIVVYLGRISLR